MPMDIHGVFYHGRIGGDKGFESIKTHDLFVSRCFDVAANYASLLSDESEHHYQEAGITVYPVRVDATNIDHLDDDRLRQIFADMLINPSQFETLIVDFNESVTKIRDEVFDYLKESGFNGAVIKKDLMPDENAEWDYVETIVLFKPELHANFALSITQTHESFMPEQVETTTKGLELEV